MIYGTSSEDARHNVRNSARSQEIKRFSFRRLGSWEAEAMVMREPTFYMSTTSTDRNMCQWGSSSGDSNPVHGVLPITIRFVYEP